MSFAIVRNSCAFAVLAFLFTTAGCRILPPDLEIPEHTQLTELETFLQQSTANQEPPALTIAVANTRGVPYARGFGIADGLKGKPAGPDTIYQWWSVTKLFTAVAILQLQEAGKLQLDDPVQKHLPDFVVEPADKSATITLRHLLSHSSGLPDVGADIMGWVRLEDEEPVNQTEFYREKLPGLNKLVFETGTVGRYTNFGYLVLAAVIEAVSGESYEDYITNRILRPLKMSRTGFVITNEMRPLAAVGTHPDDVASFVLGFMVDLDRMLVEKRDGMNYFRTVYSLQKGATGLIGPASDLARFMGAVLNHGSFDGARILTPASVELMLGPVVKAEGSFADGFIDTHFGLGWFVHKAHEKSSERIYSHGGGGPSFVAMVRLFPKRGLAVVALANSTYLGRDMGSELVKAIGAFNWK